MRILFIVTEDWYFCSHRLSLAQAALRKGHEVWLATRVGNLGGTIRQHGIHLLPLQYFNRKLSNPLSEIRKFSEILKILRRLKPDVVHNVAMKPVFYGTLAARIAGTPTIINALAGMGFLFVSENPVVIAFRRLAVFLLRILMRTPRAGIIVQNETDCQLLIRQRIAPEDRVILIPGSGVNPEVFRFLPELDSQPVVLLPSRMLMDKGVGEFIEAARLINHKSPQARFVLVGKPDEENPASIPRSRLVNWEREGVVEWWGHRKDMPKVYALANIVCLPSYREGLPKALVEAAACGRAIVTTDVPGCNDVVRNGVNGLLVPSRDPDKLAEAILMLIQNPSLRGKMGKIGRQRAISYFSESCISDKIIRFYFAIAETASRRDHKREFSINEENRASVTAKECCG